MHNLQQLSSGELTGARRFSMAAGITDFPRELFALEDSLEVLDLCDNQLSSLPEDFGRFKRLKAVFFFNNQFDHIPAVLKDCPKLDVYGFRYNRIHTLDVNELPENLRWLILTGNKITKLPDGFGRFKRLQKCMLAGNQLTGLPDDLSQCHNLELLRISSNQFECFPEVLLELPKLTWLAYAGNPFCESIQPRLPELTTIPWSSLKISEELGQGASGIIYKATWQRHDGDATTVAVKVFKGEMTSDGSPMDERNATVLAGTHPNLVPLLGAIGDHPEQKNGLVLELIPASYKNMAGPPSLQSCTRDTYPDDCQFTAPGTLAVAKQLVQVCQHLHNNGILHGDFYPHNVLLTSNAETLVTDFGAACFYDRKNTRIANSLERLEVRSFACALDDMLTLISPDMQLDEHRLVSALAKIRDTCFKTTPAQRPLFSEIVTQLEAL